MMRLSFTVEAWSAWSPEKPLVSQWRAWASGTESAPPENTQATPDVSMIPAIKRRRMSTLSRLAYATAVTCNPNQAEAPICVFASRHGDLTRTCKILQAIADAEDVSPTDFSMSVHNTAAGLFSIFTGNREPSTTIVGGEDTFNSALLEASNYLRRFPDKPVLLVYFDEPVPRPFFSTDSKENYPLCVALLLSPHSIGNEQEFSHEFSDNESGKSDGRNPVESFLHFFLGREKSVSCLTRRGHWIWSRT